MLTIAREQDDKKPKSSNEDDTKSSDSASSSANSTNEIDWDGVSSWCQAFLRLPDSELNSLWYERLAEASSRQNSKADTIMSLYQRAIEKNTPSWLCHRGLGTTHFGQERTQEAIAQVRLAMEQAEQGDATPKPEAKDIMELHLLLGQYLHKAGEVQKAAEHYLLACKSEDPEQVKTAQLGHLRATLSFPDAEGTRQLLESTLAEKGGLETMGSVLKMIAQDTEHDVLVSKIFTVAKGHPDLLAGVVRAMETATADSALNKDRVVELVGDDRFADDEARGVLLCDRGFAAYMYKATSNSTDAISEALRLWKESRDVLSNVGGRNAYIARQEATTALARHYFQSMVDRNHLDHVEALTKLAEADSNVYRSDSVGFLATLYALRGEKQLSRAILDRRIRQSLQVLSDDMPDNDVFGFSSIHKTLEEYQDFKQATVALSLLGQPDIITDALCFELKDIVGEEDAVKEKLLDIVNKLAKETVQVAKTKVPDFKQQIQRIEAAKAHVDSLMAVVKTTPIPEASDSLGETDRPDVQGEDKRTVSNLEISSAHSLIHSRLSALQKAHTPKIDLEAFQYTWTCDGRTSDGKPCENEFDFTREFYHCTYCSNRDFCGECITRLRVPDSGADIKTCSPKHRWLRMPPQGADMYVGPRAKVAPVPSEVRAMEADASILEIYYGENGTKEEVTVEAWKQQLARDWGISLDEIKKEMSTQSTSQGKGNERVADTGPVES